MTSMDRMFALAFVFNQESRGWDMSAVTRMNKMCLPAKASNQDISAWDVSAVTSFSSPWKDILPFYTDDGLMFDETACARVGTPSFEENSKKKNIRTSKERIDIDRTFLFPSGAEASFN